MLPPQGEARDDHAIFAALGHRLGVEQAFTEGLAPIDWLRRIYTESAAKIAATGINLPDFDHFWEEGIIDLSTHDAPHIMHDGATVLNVCA